MQVKSEVYYGGRGKMRLFVSIDLPKIILHEMNHIQKALLDLNNECAFFEAKPVASENMHITLVFFGSVPDESLPSIQERLSHISCIKNTIKLNMLELNSLRKPHILWVTIYAPFLIELANCIQHLFPEYAETRAFNGHITIMRIKKVFDKKRFQEMIEKLSIQPLSWTAESFSLYQSQTFQQGPVYTLIAQYPFIPVNC